MKVQGVYPGVLAPDFETTALDGKRFRLSDLRGKVVLLDFWATWCAPCVAELPNVEQACEIAGELFAVVGISFDRDADTARKFATGRKLNWTQIWADRGDKSPLADDYGVSAIPASFLIGPDGKVLGRDLRGAALLDAVRKATAGLAPQRPASRDYFDLNGENRGRAAGAPPP